MKKTIKIFPNGSYYGNILFTCGYSFDEIIARLLTLPDINWAVAVSLSVDWLSKQDYGCIYEHLDGEDYYIIYFKSPFSEGEEAILSHEVVHLCQFCLPGLLDRNKECEAEAYHHQYVMEQCLKALKK